MTTATSALLPPPPGIPTVGHGERKHARSSPSKLKSLEICPSYVSDNDGPAHFITERGTAMHEAMETGNDTQLVEKDGELDLVNMCREFLAPELANACLVIDEAHLKTNDPDVQGFVDKVIFDNPQEGQPRIARIRDFKFGYNMVDSPDRNPQAIAYTVGVFLKYPEIDLVNFAFLLPRLGEVLEHTFVRAELPALELRIATIAERVRQLEGKVFNLVEENCLYCARKFNCPKVTGKVLTIANGYNEDTQLVLPDQFHSSLITDPADMAKALNAAVVMEKWCESVCSHALKMREEQGIDIPGYDYIETQGKRTINNPQGAYDIAQTFGVSLMEFLSAATVSVPKLIEYVREKTPAGIKKKDRERDFTDQLVDSSCASRGTSFFSLRRKKVAKPIPTNEGVEGISYSAPATE